MGICESNDYRERKPKVNGKIVNNYEISKEALIKVNEINEKKVDIDGINKNALKKDNKTMEDEDKKEENIKNIITKSLVKIIKNNKEIRFGFLCKIPFPDQFRLLPVLITNYDALEKDVFIQHKPINISLDSQNFTLKIDDKKIYRNVKYDIIIIEIKNVNNFTLLDIDDVIYYNNPYIKKEIILINYPYDNNNNNISELGSIEAINAQNNIIIKYLNENGERDKGGIILNSFNNKVLGIKKMNDSNMGILIQGPIKDFNSKFKQNQIEENNKNNNIIKNSKIKSNEIQNNNNFFIKSNKEEQIKLLQTNLISHKNPNIDNNSINQNVNPYIKALLVSFYEIANLKQYFIDDYSYFKTKNCHISYDICKFLQNYAQQNYSNCEKCISNLETLINQNDKNVLKNGNFITLIHFFLNKCHEELNTKQKTNKNAPKEDYDEKISYYNFKKYYFEQNESAIQKYFYGIQEKIELYKCCNLKTYSFEILKYLFFKLDKYENEKLIDLQTLIYNMENIPLKHQKYCSMCCIQSDTLLLPKLYDNPEILVIVLYNIKKKPVNFNTIIKTKKNEYKLLCCITESENEIKFNIIFNLNNIWHVIKNNDYTEEKEIGGEIGSLMQYPCVLFYEKGNKLKDNNKNDISSISNNTSSYNFTQDSKSINKNNNLETQNQIDINKNQNVNNNISNVQNNIYNNNPNNAIYNKSTYNNNSNNSKLIMTNNPTQYNNKMYTPHNIKPNKNMTKNHSSKLLNVNSNITQYNINKYFLNNNNNNNNNINNFNNLNYNNNENFILSQRNKNANNYMNNYNNMNFNNNIIMNNKFPQKSLNSKTSINNNPNYQTLTNYNMNNIIKNTPFNNKNNNKLNGVQSKNINIKNPTINNNNMQFKVNNNNFNNQNIIQNPNLNKITIPQNNTINNNYVNNNKQSNNGEMITLYFKLIKSGKELYLDVKESDYFSNVYKELFIKYDWLKNIKIIKCQCNGINIDFKKTVKDNGLKDNSQILLLEQ